jgi:rhamnosyltransferase
LKEKNRELLAGCVILYNPDVSITKNIESYLHFVNVLYVIDNSEKVDGELVDALLLLGPKIRYLPQSSNIGVASALNIGASSAVREKYNWLLTMDQDSYFFGSDFFDTWNIDGTLNNKIGLIAASYTNEYDRWQKDYSSNYNEIHFVVTSGNIINLKAWSEVNGFEDKLFIDEVDHEYCLKLRKNKYRILISKKILLGHVVGEIRQRGHILEKRRKITLHNPVRYYYISRNVLFLCKKYFFIDLKFVLQRLYYLVKTLIRIILLYPDKLMYLKFFFAGIRDFTLSKYNKLDDAIIS